MIGCTTLPPCLWLSEWFGSSPFSSVSIPHRLCGISVWDLAWFSCQGSTSPGLPYAGWGDSPHQSTTTLAKRVGPTPATLSPQRSARNRHKKVKQRRIKGAIIINNRRLVTLAEHTSDHGRQTNSSTEEKGKQV